MIYIGYTYKPKYLDYRDEGIYFSILDPQSRMWVRFFTETDLIENQPIILESVIGFRNYKYKGVNQMLPEVVVYSKNG